MAFTGNIVTETELLQDNSTIHERTDPSTIPPMDQGQFFANLITTVFATVGKTVLSGSTAPSRSTGDDGDIYFQKTSNEITFFGPKASGAWGTGISLNGTDGTDGASITSGSSVPNNASGNNGDFYVRTITNGVQFYLKSSGTWTSLTSVTDGRNGTDGRTILSGSGVPNNANGDNGDVYIRTSSTAPSFYIKASGSWGTAISMRGNNGTNGWSISITPVTSGERILHRVTWVGGTGTPPAGNNQFISPIGFTSDSSQATNYRGPAGSGSGSVTPGTPGRNGQFERTLYTVLNDNSVPSTPTASNPTINTSTGNVTFGSITSGWTNTHTESAVDYTTQRVWKSKVGLRWSADNSSISIIYTTAPSPDSPRIGSGGTTPPPPSTDFDFEWRDGTSGNWTTVAGQTDGTPFDVSPVIASGVTGLQFRVPDTHRITSIQSGLGGVFGTNRISQWTESVTGGYATYTRSGLLDGNYSYRITGGPA